MLPFYAQHADPLARSRSTVQPAAGVGGGTGAHGEAEDVVMHDVEALTWRWPHQVRSEAAWAPLQEFSGFR